MGLLYWSDCFTEWILYLYCILYTQCLLQENVTLRLWVRFPRMVEDVFDKHVCDKFCEWLATDRYFRWMVCSFPWYSDFIKQLKRTASIQLKISLNTLQPPIPCLHYNSWNTYSIVCFFVNPTITIVVYNITSHSCCCWTWLNLEKIK
jgi:hypothetical protein